MAKAVVVNRWKLIADLISNIHHWSRLWRFHCRSSILTFVIIRYLYHAHKCLLCNFIIFTQLCVDIRCKARSSFNDQLTKQHFSKHHTQLVGSTMQYWHHSMIGIHYLEVKALTFVPIVPFYPGIPIWIRHAKIFCQIEPVQSSG